MAVQGDAVQSLPAGQGVTGLALPSTRITVLPMLAVPLINAVQEPDMPQYVPGPPNYPRLLSSAIASLCVAWTSAM